MFTMHHYIKFTMFVCILGICAQMGQSLPTNHQITERAKRGIFSTLTHLSSGNGANILNTIKDIEDEEAAPTKPKPYAFNDMEMTAIQAMISLRDILGDLLHRVGFNIPSSLASLITRSENNDKGAATSFLTSESSGAGLGSLTSSKANNVAVLLRGLALSLPLLIPMATQIRRMSTDSVVVPQLPQLPLLPDPYYNQALHRRRGKRSLNRKAMTVPLYRAEHLYTGDQILRSLRKMEAKYGKSN